MVSKKDDRQKTSIRALKRQQKNALLMKKLELKQAKMENKMAVRMADFENAKKRIEKTKKIDLVRPYGCVLVMAIAFLFGFVDMLMLSKSIESLELFSPFLSAVFALMLAQSANIVALTMGKKNGETLEDHIVNDRNKHFFFCWLVIACIYIIVRGVGIHNELSSVGVADAVKNGIITYAMLSISYTLSGLTIWENAARFWNYNSRKCQEAKKSYDKALVEYQNAIADLQEDIDALEGYNRHYENLDKIYNEIKKHIYSAEYSTMSDITGKAIESGADVNPIDAKNVFKDAISSRKMNDGEEI